MIRIAIVMAIFMALALVLTIWIRRRQVTEQREKAFPETVLPLPNTPEEKLVLHLLDKIKASSTQLYFGTFESRRVFSDGHFLEFADKLPPAIEKLGDLSSQSLSEDAIRHIIPPDADGLAEEVQGERERDGKYELLSRTHKSIVGALYYDYLKMRYSKAKVFCRGETQPVTFWQEGVLKAVLMPIKE